MSKHPTPWRGLVAVSAIALLAACTTAPPPPLASNPPPVQPGPSATWYHVEFGSNSHAIDAKGAMTLADVTNSMRQNPALIATIIGKTDTVGSADYNMHLSHRRADAVRDALVYRSNVEASRVETRWTGETKQRVATAGNVPSEPNRVVDIALH